MNSQFIHIILFLLMSLSACQNENSKKETPFSDLKTTLDSLTETGFVPGISLSVFKKDSLLLVHTSGYASIKDSVKVDKTTNFEAASLSKPITAHIYLKNFKNKIPLDTSLLSYFTQSITNNTTYLKQVSPYLILSHQSGLPNWRAMPNTQANSLREVFNKTDSLNFRFEPGSQFGYSGEGYIWLQGAIEKVSGKDFQQIAYETIFSPADTRNSTFIFPELNKQTATPYDENGEKVNKQIIKVSLASASLHSNAIDYAKMFQYYLKDKSSLFNPVVEVDTVGNYHVKWAPGVGIMSNDSGDKYLFHWGDNGPFKSYVIYNTKKDLGFVYFTNSSNGLKIRDLILKKIYDTHIPMWPQDYMQIN